MKATLEHHLKDLQSEYPGPKGCCWLVCSSNSKTAHGIYRRMAKGKGGMDQVREIIGGQIMSHLGVLIITLAFTLSKLDSQEGFEQRSDMI